MTDAELKAITERDYCCPDCGGDIDVIAFHKPRWDSSIEKYMWRCRPKPYVEPEGGGFPVTCNRLAWTSIEPPELKQPEEDSK